MIDDDAHNLINEYECEIDDYFDVGNEYLYVVEVYIYI
jgi:hypothetical protein